MAAAGETALSPEHLRIVGGLKRAGAAVGAGFRTFKDSVQEACVRRRGTGDDRLFLAGNVALGLAAAAMAAVAIAYEPISAWLVAGSAAGALALIAALVRRRLR